MDSCVLRFLATVLIVIAILVAIVNDAVAGDKWERQYADESRKTILGYSLDKKGETLTCFFSEENKRIVFQAATASDMEIFFYQIYVEQSRVLASEEKSSTVRKGISGQETALRPSAHQAVARRCLSLAKTGLPKKFIRAAKVILTWTQRREK